MSVFKTVSLRLFALIFASLGIFSILALQSSTAFATSYPYNSSNLISDDPFMAYSSMTASQIQTFLTNENSGLKSYKEVEDCGSSSGSHYSYYQTYYHCGVSELASQIIYDSAQAYKISPKAILATIQKEQSLVTDPTAPADNMPAIDCAMGYYSCGGGFNTFFSQVDNGTWQFRTYIELMSGRDWWGFSPSSYPCSTGGTPAHSNGKNTGASAIFYSTGLYPGRAVTFYDYNGDGYTRITLANAATAALYCYTPHVYPGSSNYYYSGSYNFVISYEQWFGSTTTSVLFKISGSPTYYLDWGGYYYPITSGTILQDYGLASVAPRSLSTFPAGETNGGSLTALAQFGTDGTFCVVEGGEQHAAPNWTVLGDYGFSANPPDFPESLGWLLKVGDGLRPLARTPNGAIYLMDNGKKRGFPDGETYSSLSGPNYQGTTQTYSQQSLTNVSSDYLDSFPEGAPMLLDGKFIKSANDAAIYLYDNGQKDLFSASSFAAWGGRVDYEFSRASLDQLSTGPAAPTLVRAPSAAKYLVDNGHKKAFSGSVQTAWGLNSSSFVNVTDRALARLGGSQASRLVTDSSPGIYYVDAGQLHGITSLSDFARLGFSWSDVDQISSEALSLVPRGADIRPPGTLARLPNGAVYLLDANYNAFGVTSGSLFSQFGFSWNSVVNIPSTGLNGYHFGNLQTLIRSNLDGSYFVVDKGVKHSVGSSEFGASEYDMGAWQYNAVSPLVKNQIATGPALTRFIRVDGSSTVYYIENGQRRPITSESEFYTLGGSWSSVVSVSNDFMNEIPRGPAI